jgi:hypothetical protein
MIRDLLHVHALGGPEHDRALRHRTTDPEPRRVIRRSWFPSSSVMSRTGTRSAMPHVARRQVRSGGRVPRTLPVTPLAPLDRPNEVSPFRDIAQCRGPSSARRALPWAKVAVDLRFLDLWSPSRDMGLLILVGKTAPKWGSVGDSWPPSRAQSAGSPGEGVRSRIACYTISLDFGQARERLLRGFDPPAIHGDGHVELAQLGAGAFWVVQCEVGVVGGGDGVEPARLLVTDLAQNAVEVVDCGWTSGGDPVGGGRTGGPGCCRSGRRSGCLRTGRTVNSSEWRRTGSGAGRRLQRCGILAERWAPCEYSK